eukprot:jgi/Bigna1/85490/estExt_fgenesh1_pg.C_40196
MGKHKRYKRVRKHLEYYKLNFGLKPPYKLVVDGNFIQQALKYKVHIKEQIPKLFQSVVVPCVTKCTVSKLRRAGSAYSGAAIIAKRFERIPCQHGKGVQKEEACLEALVGQSNASKLCFGAQTVSLRNTIRRVPAAPIIFIRECVPIFEPPSKATKTTLKNKLSTMGSLSSSEEKKIKAVVGEDATKTPEPFKRKKRKGPRQPNPLSCKKKKKLKLTDARKTASQPSRLKKEKGNSGTEQERASDGKGDKLRSSSTPSDAQKKDGDMTEEEGGKAEEKKETRKRRRRGKKKKKKKSSVQSNLNDAENDHNV